MSEFKPNAGLTGTDDELTPGTELGTDLGTELGTDLGTELGTDLGTEVTNYSETWVTIRWIG